MAQVVVELGKQSMRVGIELLDIDKVPPPLKRFNSSRSLQQRCPQEEFLLW